MSELGAMSHGGRAEPAPPERRPSGGQDLYGAYFGVAASPFSLAPDPSYLYMSEKHQAALAHLLYGVRHGSGFVLLTGEVGTGKTTLCRCLLEQLPRHVDLALVLNPKLNETELLAAICDDLDVGYPPGTTSLKDLVGQLNRRLLETHAKGRDTVLVVDEAQNLSPGVLEQIRLLTNLETNTAKLLQVILIGQPELNDLLARPELRQLAQRITARFHLEPLDRAETEALVRHRLSVAGLRLHGDLFTSAALQELYECASGVPRLINIVADRALLGAYARDRTFIDRALVRAAAQEVLPPRDGAGRSRSGALAGFGAVLLVAALAIWVAFDPFDMGLPAEVLDLREQAAQLVGAGAPAPADPLDLGTPLRAED